MIAWDTIRPVIRTTIETIGGLQTVWIDKPRPYIDTSAQAIVLLRVRTSRGIGTDDRRYSDLGLAKPAATLEEQLAGSRAVSLDVRVESFRHDDDRFAFNVAEKIRTALGFGSTRASLRAVNVAIVKASDALDVSGVVQDDRVTSIAVLDVALAIGQCTADETEAHRVFNIETVDPPVDHASTVIDPPC